MRVKLEAYQLQSNDREIIAPVTSYVLMRGVQGTPTDQRQPTKCQPEII